MGSADIVIRWEKHLRDFRELPWRREGLRKLLVAAILAMMIYKQDLIVCDGRRWEELLGC